MLADDLPAVARVADELHPTLVEDAAVFAERRRLYPAGCHVAAAEGILGYAIAHPWRGDMPPKLNGLLSCLPDDPNLFYLHDIALLPAARGQGLAAGIVALLAGHAQALGLTRIALVSVGDSFSFWAGLGFVATASSGLAQYGPGARYMVRSAGWCRAPRRSILA